MEIPLIIKRILQSDNKRTATIKKNIAGSIAIKGVTVIVSFLLVSLTIDYISPELYGVWLILSSILTWISFFDLGFTQGLKNRLTEAIAKDDWNRARSLVSTTYFMMVIIFVPVCIILEIATPYIDWCKWLNVSTKYASDIIRVMHVLFAFVCIQFVVNVIISVLAAFQRVAFSNLFSAIGSVCTLIVIFVVKQVCPPSLLILSFALSIMPVLSMLVGSLLLYRSSLSAVRPSIKKIRISYVGDLYNLGYKFFIINIQAVILYQATNILISNISTPLDVTSYNIAYRYLNAAMMIYTLATTPLWPAYSDAYAREDYDWMLAMKNKMMMFWVFSACVCVFLVIISKFVYHLWIGDSVNVPYTMTILVGVYVIVYSWMTLNGTLIVGMGKVKLETIIVIIGMLLHIPLSFFLGKFIGSYGVVMSMIIINTFYACMFHIQVHKLLNRTAIGIWGE